MIAPTGQNTGRKGGYGRDACSGQVPLHGAVILTFAGIVDPFPRKFGDPLKSVFRGN
jgi:hypothetical protein